MRSAENSASSFAKPVMLLSSPEGIAAPTQPSAYVTSNRHANSHNMWTDRDSC